ncbi:DUF2339 domain-containing protein [Croceicoccus sediminis]|uniref:DUF2339 domain-containing protein n=1 Tax=Croceicoccus sediminis TaxID=2571150 RepID=UPI001183B62A|nr:DUF2339 domain-containing protein [Croceicoccus sediminis]
MEWLIIIGMGVTLYQLWRRVERLEERLSMQEMLGRRPVVPMEEAAMPVVEPVAEHSAQPEPAAATTVPRVRRAVARVTGSVSSMTSRPAATTTVSDEKPGIAFNFEDLFGRQLPIWAGGITLAIAGFFLVMYAIELGLLSPSVRVFMGFLFGGTLIGGAFVAEKMAERIADIRVPQALAGAGIATLYACFYLAGTGYGLIGAGFAFAGLAAVTAGAIYLSFRFGLPCAVLGLLGGFAAPMMVSADEANLPILSIYLALVSAGLVLTGNRQQRPWLGAAAMGGGLLWGLLLLFSQDLTFADQLFVGVYLIGVGAVLPTALGEVPFRHWLRAGAGAFAALQMAILIDQGGYSLLAWGLYVLLGGALAFLAWKKTELRDPQALAAAIAIFMLAFWPNPEEGEFALIGGAMAAIFAVVPLFHIWRGERLRADVVQVAGFAPGLALAATWQFGDVFHDFLPVLGAVSLALAALPALAASRLSPDGGWKVWLLEFSAAMTCVVAFSQVLHDDWGAIACALAAIALALGLPRRVAAARTFAGVAAAFAVFPLIAWIDAGLDALVGEPFFLSDLESWQDTMRYLVPGVLATLVVAYRQTGIGRARVVQAMAVLGGAGAVIALHSFYKLGFAIDGYTRFVTYGLAERTVWEALLVAAAFALFQVRDRIAFARMVAIALLAAALAHFGWFTFLWHNPLGTAQAVGPMPVANLALAAYGVAIAALVIGKSVSSPQWRRAADIAIMVLLPVLAITLLRQGFSGTILTAQPMGQGEDLLRSLSGIVLAIGYLLWGARREDRTWRIGSLVLMILAVGKVFIVDAAVLEGLARIASFLALGFSLIGIGWFYSRILARPRQDAPQP